jgi:hypothetical protein
VAATTCDWQILYLLDRGSWDGGLDGACGFQIRNSRQGFTIKISDPVTWSSPGPLAANLAGKQIWGSISCWLDLLHTHRIINRTIAISSCPCLTKGLSTRPAGFVCSQHHEGVLDQVYKSTSVIRKLGSQEDRFGTQR